MTFDLAGQEVRKMDEERGEKSLIGGRTFRRQQFVGMRPDD
jgi:hypothetical protein